MEKVLPGTKTSTGLGRIVGKVILRPFSSFDGKRSCLRVRSTIGDGFCVVALVVSDVRPTTGNAIIAANAKAVNLMQKTMGKTVLLPIITGSDSLRSTLGRLVYYGKIDILLGVLPLLLHFIPFAYLFSLFT